MTAFFLTHECTAFQVFYVKGSDDVERGHALRCSCGAFYALDPEPGMPLVVGDLERGALPITTASRMLEHGITTLAGLKLLDRGAPSEWVRRWEEEQRG